MAREIFIERFNKLSRTSTYESITNDINDYFFSKKSNFIEQLIPAIVKEKYDVIKYTRICQFIDAFIFKYKTFTVAHIAAIVFILLDPSKNLKVKRSDTSKYFTKTSKANLKELKRLEKETGVDSNGLYSIDEFISLYENVNEVQLDSSTVKQCILDWSFKSLFDQYAKGKNYISDSDVLEGLKKQFKIKEHLNALKVVIRLMDTSRVHKFRLYEFNELCLQIAFVEQKVGINIFSLNVISFRLLDNEHNGFLTLQKYSRFLQKSGFDIKKDNVKKSIKELDSNGDGVLQIDEFIHVSNGLCTSKIPASFLNNLRARNQTDLKYDSEQPQNMRTTVQILRNDNTKKEKNLNLIRTTITSDEYSKLFDELCPTHKMNMDSLRSALITVIGETNTQALRTALPIIFNVGNINCDGYLDKEEFIILMTAIGKCMKNKVITERDMYEVFFHCVDGDHDGLINSQEVSFLVQQIDGDTLTEEEANDLIRTYDETGKKELNLEEYLCYFMRLDEIKLDDSEEIKQEKMKRQIAKTFRLIDKDYSKSIEYGEALNYVINTVGQISQTNKICLSTMFYVCDLDENNSLDPNEFFQFYYLFEYYVDENGEFDYVSIYVELFDMLDVKNEKILPRYVVDKLLEKIGRPESILNFMIKYDLNKKDFIQINEFVLAFCGKSLDDGI
ncbi:hypothetical protein ENUP19_0340G0057 [Entamoeba nuttalli]|uniref:EF-hand calcium-binding domain containing protein n=2 Tax=Entamoeba nuttalli TaxID=412467 RepID=K2HH55_ENTNP|nr:EF-hand calcium-binding domain containing protein [Entamoeba nuttalli P19]EKE42249.1 EF-hand calcium-binding domain containing protein [Entamoeba nuttalli P19]|eukprot:XP_008855420.1 EF-hand calcium-binding domain containing protein [Entamoeba nuttalli P19]